MYIKRLKIKGYRVFNEEFEITLNKGLNVLVGENASGKSSIVDALRLLLLEDEYGRTGVEQSDFHRPLSSPSKSLGSAQISIRCEFEDLSDEQQVAYLPWLDIAEPTRSILNLAIENKEDARGRFKRRIWGNESETGLFEWELLNRISCIYLPPLRNAEDRLRAYKGSRLGRLLKNLKLETADDELHPLEKKFADLNSELLEDDLIKIANQQIKQNIVESVGAVFGQDASLQFSEINFDRIVERIRLLFYPILPQPGSLTDLNLFRELSENSLGYNNIIYLATVLAEFHEATVDKSFHKVLLIEEPEAHLHPQLQIRLLKYLQEKAREDNIQVIVTTHSPTLSSSLDLDSIKVLTVVNNASNPVFTPLIDCRLDASKKFLERWLDITKSILLYAKGILFVEGIAEALVIKELSKFVLADLQSANAGRIFHADLESYGISIINLNGIYFNHFFSLFKGYVNNDGEISSCAGIPIRCAGLTDNDPLAETKPTPIAPATGENHQLHLISELYHFSLNCRLFTNMKTFEYDLAMEGNNLAVMAGVQLQLVTTDGSIRRQLTRYSVTDWNSQTQLEKSEASYWLLNHIEKGEFAQMLAEKLAEPGVDFEVPRYIVDAIKWLVW